MQIGFFDSGVGGITVLYEALKLLPHEDYIYYSDVVNVPYGNKTKDEIRKFTSDAIEFIVAQGAKAIVIACNTATSAAIEDLRKRHNIPIIGMEPAVKPAVEKNGHSHKRVLVTATAFTLKEEKLKNLIERLDNENIVDLLPLPGLVEFAERLEFNSDMVRAYLKEELGRYDLMQYSTIVLGCTHFPFYKDVFKELLPQHVDIIDGNLGTVKNLKRILEEHHLTNRGTGKVTFYHSGKKVEGEPDLESFHKLFIRLQEIEIEQDSTSYIIFPTDREQK